MPASCSTTGSPGKTAVDLNRAGTPLAEIVSEPDIRSPAEARAYLVTLRQILVYAGVSDCSMEQGSLRVDANISIRRPGDPKLGTKTEVKNLNSFANVERALEAERERQIALLERGERVAQVTLLFNAATGQVRPLRSKEESHDYRYFPDPDLPPLVVAPELDRGAARGAARAARGAPGAAGAGVWPLGLRRAGADRRGRAGRVLRGGGAGRRRAQDRRQLGHGRRDDQLQRDRRVSGVRRRVWQRSSRWCATAP